MIFLPAWSVQVPPLGLASIGAFLKAQGHQVKMFDWNAKLRKEADDRSLWDLAQYHQWCTQSLFDKSALPRIKGRLGVLAREIAQSDFDAVGFTALRSNIFTVAHVSRVIRDLNPRIRTFIGGPSSLPTEGPVEACFANGHIDAAVMGEGEYTALALLNAWSLGEPVAKLPGVMTRTKSGQLVTGPPPAPIELSSLPPPDFSDFDFTKYTDRLLPIQLSRGCVGNCSFCVEKSVLWPCFRMKTAEQVLHEFRALSVTCGIHSFAAADSLLNGDHKKLEAIADLLIAENLAVSWGGNMRIDRKLTPALLAKLKQAHCDWVIFGAESGSDTILKAMRKGVSRKDILSVIKNTHKAGIQVAVNIIVGFPGETEEHFQETVTLLEDCAEQISYLSTSVYSVTPDSQVAKNPASFGIKTDTKDRIVWDDLPLDMQGWSSESGDSTRSIRDERLRRLREHVKDKITSITRLKHADEH